LYTEHSVIVASGQWLAEADSSLRSESDTQGVQTANLQGDFI
jgi:hypothetical protein